MTFFLLMFDSFTTFICVFFFFFFTVPSGVIAILLAIQATMSLPVWEQRLEIKHYTDKTNSSHMYHHYHSYHNIPFIFYVIVTAKDPKFYPCFTFSWISETQFSDFR